MKEMTRLALRALRRFGLRPAAAYLRRTVNLLTRSYIPIYLIGFVGAIVLESAAVALWTAVICDIIGYLFGARLVAAYAVTRPFLRKVFDVTDQVEHGHGHSVTRVPTVANVFYWKAFIAMWVTLPLYGLAILRPWRVGWTAEMLMAVFMLLHMVATQREWGTFWRKVYGVVTAGVFATMVFAVVLPGKYNLVTSWASGGEAIDQMSADRNNTFRTKLEEEIRSYDADIAALELERAQYYRTHSAPWSKEAEIPRLQTYREETASRIRTLTHNDATGSMSQLIRPRRWNERTIATLILGGAIFGLVLLSATREKSAHH